MSDTLLRVEDLKIYYPVAGSGFGKKEFVKAVDGVTFEVKKGEVFGIVGESGCGKSTLGRGVCKLENLTSGHVYLDGEDITEYNDRRMRSIRKKVQMVFQDPYASLNPRMSVFDIIAEPLLVHHLYQDKADLEKKVLDLLHRVGLDDYHANRYPHEFSGGQRQRIGIARALAVQHGEQADECQQQCRRAHDLPCQTAVIADMFFSVICHCGCVAPFGGLSEKALPERRVAHRAG